MTSNDHNNLHDSNKNSWENSKLGSKQNSLKLIDDDRPMKNKIYSQNEILNLKKSFKDDSLVNNSNLNESNIEKKNLLVSKHEEKSK